MHLFEGAMLAFRNPRAHDLRHAGVRAEGHHRPRASEMKLWLSFPW